MARRPKLGAGDTALVTGASTGIGRSFARQLAARGFDLVLVARDAARLEELAGELTAAHGVAVEVLPADLTDPDERAAVEDRLARPDGRAPVALLVNNAGWAQTGRFDQLDVDAEESVIRLNVLAVARLAHAALGGMRARRRGAVVNVSSVGGFAPLGGVATYTASKAFVTAHSQALAQEARRDGVTVMALCPGWTRTEFQERTGYHASRTPGPLWMGPDEVVSTALTSLDRGRTMSIPGAAYKVIALLARATPMPVVARVGTMVGREPNASI